jgi:DNA-binding MarR family transcriptional regulator
MAGASVWPGPDPADLTAWTIVQAGHVTGRRFSTAFAQVGLSATQFGVLLLLDLHPGLSGGEIARRVAVTPQSVSGLVTALVDLGLVTRDPSPGRGHRGSAQLTESGRATLLAAYDAIEAVNSTAALGLTEDESATLNRLLHKVLTSEVT